MASEGTPGAQLARWNQRFARGECCELEPAPLLSQAVAGLPPGRALDLACGPGRHALFLAERGWQVVAVDGAPVAIERLRSEAARRGLGARIDARVADLESEPPGFAIEPGAYDLIAEFFYLHRPLLPTIRAGLRPGGLWVAAIHVAGPSGARPHRFALSRGELERWVRGWAWDIVHLREGSGDGEREGDGDGGRSRAELVARRPRD